MNDYHGFYNKLNGSQNLEEISLRFAKYRHDVTNIIEEAMNIKQRDSYKLLVFGAGNLMDIDYKRLIAYKKELSIHLTDIDQLSMESGLDYLNIKSHVMRTTSFNYIGDGKLENNINLLINQLNLPMISEEESVNRVESFFKTILKDLNSYTYEDIIGTEYDIVIVLPIYTQILYLELVHKLEHTKGFKYIQGYLLQQMIYVINEFNQKVVKSVDQDGLLIVLSDIIEENLKDNAEIRQSLDISRKIEAYEKTYGVGLGSFGLLNIVEYITPIKEYYINWEFNEERRFLVKGLLLSY